MAMRTRQANALAATEDDLATGSEAPSAPDRTLERALGQQVRFLRHQNDLSISDLSASAGISSGMLSKIENGQISPSLATLNAIAEALSVQISTLFSGFEERRDCSYVHAGDGVAIERRGTKVGHAYHLLGHGVRGNVVVEPYLIELDESAQPYTGFRHGGTEFIYMLSGKIVYRHGDRSYPLNTGDALLFDSAAHHGPEILKELPAEFLSIIVYSRDDA
ncbi:helix-turn-helix domain-containing protein [Amorphus coralli]|uniref:helix-turn-helix domain-containing protein n=1 Tax=Amorphus coralli TaxID=340680 RepID=UPI000360CF7E|nr:XRE family transcriptional regulator [Amorphus coralli]